MAIRVLAGVIWIMLGTLAFAYPPAELLVRFDFNKGRGASVTDATGLGFVAQLYGNARFIDNDPLAGSDGKALFGNAMQAKAAHKRFADNHSDFLTLWNVFVAYSEASAKGMYATTCLSFGFGSHYQTF